MRTLELVPGSKLEEAVTDANNQREALCAFLQHGEVEISNNPAENAIRPFVVGRKNWLFSDTPKGADSSAIVYTLVETAKANGVEPSLCVPASRIIPVALSGKEPVQCGA